MTIRIGCSGWNYRHWRGLFYPQGLPVRRWFEHYGSLFDTVEINNSFYRLPPESTFAAWAEQAPPGFLYAVKANRFLTHQKKLKDPEEPIDRMLSHVRHLGDTLGPILYQLPPRWQLDLARLRDFLALLPGDLSHVFEFRDPSWLTDAVYALLDEHGAGFCTHDMPGLNPPRIATGRIAYVRFHGAGGKYWGRYGEAALVDWCEWLQAETANGRHAYAYFNNDWNGDAIEDALALQRIAGQPALPLSSTVAKAATPAAAPPG